MSEELERIEKLARQKCITDHEHIRKILDYVLSRPLSYFQKDKKRFNYLKNELSTGFNTNYRLEKMPLRDILTLIGYEPGKKFFDPPDTGKMIVDSRFNSAGHCYIIALLLDSYTNRDIHIKEFMHIHLGAFTDHLHETINNDLDNCLISLTSASGILERVDEFKKKAVGYMSKRFDPHMIVNEGRKPEDFLKLGDIIYQTLKENARSWMCSVIDIYDYASGIIDTYDLLNRLFMDAVRMPLIHSDRERFKEIMRSCCFTPEVVIEDIDYENCYEHGGVSRL
ncbi:MAG: hypothetical protein IJP84_06110 [Lachnospiraceae bacterium]|nr:hypothetical protein [Lachnospiraceae bacterium]